MTSVLACSLFSCQLQQQQHEEEKKEEDKKPAPIYLGSVHQVYPEKNFALLRIIGPMPGPDDTLITHPSNGSNERVGNLVVSMGQPARNNIITADIRSGTVVRGDLVFQYRDISEPDSKEQEMEEIPEVPEIPGGIPTSSEPATTVLPEHPSLTNILPVQDPADVLEEEESPAPAAPAYKPTPAPASKAPMEIPDYLDEIPDDIKDWD